MGKTFNRAAFVSPNLMREKNFIRGKCVVRFIVLLRGVATFLREGRKDFLGSEGVGGDGDEAAWVSTDRSVLEDIRCPLAAH